MAELSTEEFTLYMACIAFVGSCVGLTFNFILKSRCSRVSCFGRECLVRDVLPATQAQLDIPPAMQPR